MFWQLYASQLITKKGILSKLSDERRDYQGKVEGKPVFALSVLFKK